MNVLRPLCCPHHPGHVHATLIPAQDTAQCTHSTHVQKWTHVCTHAPRSPPHTQMHTHTPPIETRAHFSISRGPSPALAVLHSEETTVPREFPTRVHGFCLPDSQMLGSFCVCRNLYVAPMNTWEEIMQESLPAFLLTEEHPLPCHVLELSLLKNPQWLPMTPACSPAVLPAPEVLDQPLHSFQTLAVSCCVMNPGHLPLWPRTPTRTPHLRDVNPRVLCGVHSWKELESCSAW